MWDVILETVLPTVVLAIGTALVGGIVRNGRKLDRLTAYLITPPASEDGIPGPLGKIQTIDERLDQQDRKLDELEAGQIEILRRLDTGNGRTIGEAVNDLPSPGRHH